MRPRPLSLLLVPLLAWLLAGTQDRAHPRELVAWSAAVAATDSPARISDVQTRLRTIAARLPERHVAPRDGESPAALPEERFLTAASQSVCRLADLQSRESSARELTFPYDATAPPTRA